MRDTRKRISRDMVGNLAVSIFIGFGIGAAVVAFLIIFSGSFGNPYEMRFSWWIYMKAPPIMTVSFSLLAGYLKIHLRKTKPLIVGAGNIS